MKRSLRTSLFLFGTIAVVLGFSGCSSSGSGSYGSSVYYGGGYYDPWYYDRYYGPPGGIIVGPGVPDIDMPIATPMPMDMPMDMGMDMGAMDMGGFDGF